MAFARSSIAGRIARHPASGSLQNWFVRWFRSDRSRHQVGAYGSQVSGVIGVKTTSEYVRGSLYGIAAVSLWAAWIFEIRASLTPSDINGNSFLCSWIDLAAISAKGRALRLTALGGWAWQQFRWVAHRLCWFPMVVWYSHLAAQAASLFTASYPDSSWPLSRLTQLALGNHLELCAV